MKKWMHEPLFISGAVVLLANPILILLIGELFPAIPENVLSNVVVISSFDLIGVILIVLSLARFRIRVGEVETASLLRALTAAQITLIISMCLGCVGFLFVACSKVTAGQVCFILHLLGVLTAIVLAVIRKFRKKAKKKPAKKSARSSQTCARCGTDLRLLSKKKITEFNGKQYCDVCAFIEQKKAEASVHPGSKPAVAAPSVHPGSKPAVAAPSAHPGPKPAVATPRNLPLTVVCAKCGQKMARDNSVKRIGKDYFCQSCYAVYGTLRIQEEKKHLEEKKRLRLEEEKRQAETMRLKKLMMNNAVCSACGVTFSKSKMLMADDRIYCQKCFDALYPADSDQQAGNESKRGSLGREAALFDRDAFRKEYRNAVADRLPKDFDKVQTVKRLLGVAEQVLVPAGGSGAYAAIADDYLADGYGQTELAAAAAAMEKALAGVDPSRSAAGWGGLEVEQLIDVYILFDYLIFALDAQPSAHLTQVCACVGLELTRRLSRQNIF